MLREAVSEGSIIMEESPPKQKSNTKVAQHEGQQDLNTTRHMNVELKHRPKLERHLKLGKYTKNPNPSLCDPFIIY